MVWRNCKKIEETGVVARKEGSVLPKSVRKEERIKLVEKMILSQEDQSGTDSIPAEITCELHNDRQSASDWFEH